MEGIFRKVFLKNKNQALIAVDNTKNDIIQKFLLILTLYAINFRWNTEYSQTIAGAGF